MKEDLHKFWERCKKYEAFDVAIEDNDRPLLGPRAARLLEAWWALAKVLRHLCEAWSVQSLNAQDRDASALAALGVGAPKLLQALNNARYLPSYDIGRRRFQGFTGVCPNEPPSLPWLLDALSHIAGGHVWHLCINDNIHVEDIITVSREAVTVGLCTTCCLQPMQFASSEDVVAMAQRSEQDPDTPHAAN